MGKVCIPEQYKLVHAIAPQSTTVAITGDYISLKDAERVTIIADFNNTGTGKATYVTVYEATSTTGAGAAATTGNTYKGWRNAGTTSTDTLSAQTDAYRFATTTDATYQQIVIQVDPSDLTVGYDCLNVRTTTGETSNSVSIDYVVHTKYPAATPPAVISS